ncbi:MAG: hypothetical protein ACI9XR_000716 [Flavobacterium sp.]|jgi:hypothetical protein
MKKLLVFAFVGLLSITTVNAQSKAKSKSSKKIAMMKSEVEGAGMVFESETIDYGNVAANSDGKREFTFVNNGNKSLIITSATGSCGCTVPTFPKEPIAPGAKAVIGVKYDTTRAGQAFNKTVTIKSNAVQGDTKVLTIKGMVLPAEAQKVESSKS